MFGAVADEFLAFVGELLAAFYVEPTTTRQAALQLDPIVLAIVIKPPIAKTRPQPLAPHFSSQLPPAPMIATSPARTALASHQGLPEPLLATRV